MLPCGNSAVDAATFQGSVDSIRSWCRAAAQEFDTRHHGQAITLHRKSVQIRARQVLIRPQNISGVTCGDLHSTPCPGRAVFGCQSTSQDKSLHFRMTIELIVKRLVSKIPAAALATLALRATWMSAPGCLETRAMCHDSRLVLLHEWILNLLHAAARRHHHDCRPSANLQEASDRLQTWTITATLQTQCW